jgi:hypothetical protein
MALACFLTSCRSRRKETPKLKTTGMDGGMGLVTFLRLSYGGQASTTTLDFHPLSTRRMPSFHRWKMRTMSQSCFEMHPHGVQEFANRFMFQGRYHVPRHCLSSRSCSNRNAQHGLRPPVLFGTASQLFVKTSADQNYTMHQSVTMGRAPVLHSLGEEGRFLEFGLRHSSLPSVP